MILKDVLFPMMVISSLLFDLKGFFYLCFKFLIFAVMLQRMPGVFSLAQLSVVCGPDTGLNYLGRDFQSQLFPCALNLV